MKTTGNEWTKTHEALRDLLDLLSCAKCKQALHDPKQFLGCGHFSCIRCIERGETTCVECQSDFTAIQDFGHDEFLDKIIRACCAIAQEVGFQKIKAKFNNNSEVMSSSEINKKVKFPLKDLNSVKIAPKKPVKKNQKRKKNAYHDGEDCKKPRLDKFTRALNDPKKINKRNHKGETLLLQACRKNLLDIVKCYLKAEADPNIPCHANWTPLQECVDWNLVEMVKILLNGGADVNQKGNEGRTALHEAVTNNNLQMIKMLLNFGANTDISDNAGKKPICYCKSDEAKILLGIDNKEEVQNDIVYDNFAAHNNGDIENDTNFNISSKRLTRNSLSSCFMESNSNKKEIPKSQDHENIKTVDSNKIQIREIYKREIQAEKFEASIKIKQNTQDSDDVEILYENITDSDITVDKSQKKECNNALRETFYSKNCKLKINTNFILSKNTKKINFSNTTNNEYTNNVKNNCSKEVVNVANAQNSIMVDLQSKFYNSTPNNDNLIIDSEEFIDVIN